MRKFNLTLTGADDSVDPEALAALALGAPAVEWGLLFDVEQTGRSRFPSAAWRRELARVAPDLRCAAHICGAEQLRLLSEASRPHDSELGRELTGFTASGGDFQRVQLNFDAQYLPLDVLTRLVASWRRGKWRRRNGESIGLITQHNEANQRVHELFGEIENVVRRYPAFYSVLFDESGGRGQAPWAWPSPIDDLPCGYAGGITLQNIDEVTEILVHRRPPLIGQLWLDIESGVRTHDRFDLEKAAALIDAWRRLGDLPAPQLTRTQHAFWKASR